MDKINISVLARILQEMANMSVDLYRGLACKFCGSGNRKAQAQHRAIRNTYGEELTWTQPQ